MWWVLVDYSKLTNLVLSTKRYCHEPAFTLYTLKVPGDGFGAGGSFR